MSASVGLVEGAPWRPANGTEGADFESRWCRHCRHDEGFGHWENEFGEDIEGRCGIRGAGLWGVQPPEWLVRNGMPWCTAYQEDPQNPARCLLTKEMF